MKIQQFSFDESENFPMFLALAISGSTEKSSNYYDLKFFHENFCLNMIQLIFLAASDVNMFYVEHQKTNNNKH